MLAVTRHARVRWLERAHLTFSRRWTNCGRPRGSPRQVLMVAITRRTRFAASAASLASAGLAVGPRIRYGARPLMLRPVDRRRQHRRRHPDAIDTTNPTTETATDCTTTDDTASCAVGARDRWSVRSRWPPLARNGTEDMTRAARARAGLSRADPRYVAATPPPRAGIYRALVGRPRGARLALLPDRPARTIVLLVRLTASRST